MGTDTFEQPAGAEGLLAGGRRVAPPAAGGGGRPRRYTGRRRARGRRLPLRADGVGDCHGIYRGLARELLAAPGAEEVHVHRLAKLPAQDDRVEVYLAEGDGRLSYLTPRSERPAGVSWVASTGRSFLAADARELAASLPRLT